MAQLQSRRGPRRGDELRVELERRGGPSSSERLRKKEEASRADLSVGGGVGGEAQVARLLLRVASSYGAPGLCVLPTGAGRGRVGCQHLPAGPRCLPARRLPPAAGCSGLVLCWDWAGPGVKRGWQRTC